MRTGKLERWRPREWQREAMRSLRGQSRAVVSAAPGNGATDLALAMLARALVNPDRQGDYLVVGASNGDAIDAVARLFSILGIRQHDGRRKSSRHTRSVFRFPGLDRRPRFLQRSSHLGTTLENIDTGSRLRTAGARGVWPLVDRVVALRPGSWPADRAAKLHDVARYLAVGPRPVDPAHPFEQMCQGGGALVYAADPEVEDVLSADQWKQANPAIEVHAHISRQASEAKTHDQIEAFKRLRLNLGADASGISALMRPMQFRRVLRRPVPPLEGVGVWGVDVGGTGGFCAAVRIGHNGRIDARCITPVGGGRGSLEAQERADGVEPGTYSAWERAGILHVDPHHEPHIERWLSSLVEEWGRPYVMAVADPYRCGAVRDAADVLGLALLETALGKLRCFQSEDVSRARRVLIDGRGTIAPESAGMLAAAIGEGRLRYDENDRSKMTKRRGPRSRDDALMALLVACGVALQEDPILGDPRIETDLQQPRVASGS